MFVGSWSTPSGYLSLFEDDRPALCLITGMATHKVLAVCRCEARMPSQPSLARLQLAVFTPRMNTGAPTVVDSEELFCGRILSATLCTRQSVLDGIRRRTQL